MSPQISSSRRKEEHLLDQPSSISTITSSSDPLAQLAPAWLTWLCEAITSGADQAEIESALRAHGDVDPQNTIRSLRSHPIFQWARSRQSEQALRQQRAQRYLELHHQLWGERRAKLPIIDQPSAEELFAHYYYSSRPVVIRGWVSEWPACHIWDPKHWIKRFAGVEVEVSSGRDQNPRFDRQFEATRATVDLGAFARSLVELDQPSNDRYLIARNYAIDRPELAALFDEIIERPYLDPSRREGSLALWFGPQGTITPLHHDTCNIMFAQVWGEKQITLIPPHAQELFEQATSMYYDLDPLMDLGQTTLHPDQITFTLCAGEALLIPVGWWHAVRSLSLSISLAMTHFIHPNSFDWYRPNSAIRRDEEELSRERSG